MSHPMQHPASSLLLFLGLLTLLGGCARESTTTLGGKTMGTTWMVKVVGIDIDQGSLKSAIEARLIGINNLMSTYINTSELSRLNQTAVGEPFPVSDENLQVFALAGEIYRDSGGQFDVTIGPLVNLWGFGPGGGEDIVPAEDALASARSRVGFPLIDVQDRQVTKNADVYIDF